MDGLLAHTGGHAESTAHYAGYRWDEWAGLVVTVLGFVIVMVMIIRQKRGGG